MLGHSLRQNPALYMPGEHSLRLHDGSVREGTQKLAWSYYF